SCASTTASRRSRNFDDAPDAALGRHARLRHRAAGPRAGRAGAAGGGRRRAGARRCRRRAGARLRHRRRRCAVDHVLARQGPVGAGGGRPPRRQGDAAAAQRRPGRRPDAGGAQRRDPRRREEVRRGSEPDGDRQGDQEPPRLHHRPDREAGAVPAERQDDDSAADRHGRRAARVRRRQEHLADAQRAGQAVGLRLQLPGRRQEAVPAPEHRVEARRRRRRSVSDGADAMALARALRIGWLAAAVLSAARIGAAQGADRQFHGLFGPAPNEQLRPQQLDVNWSLYGAQDDNSFLSNDTDVLDAPLQTDRVYTGAAIALAYTRRPPHKLLTVNASSAARYYPDLHQVVSTRYSGGLTYEVMPAERWVIQTAGTVSYSPYYQVVLGAATAESALDLPTPNADYAAARHNSMTYGSFVSARRI